MTHLATNQPLLCKHVGFAVNGRCVIAECPSNQEEAEAENAEGAADRVPELQAAPSTGASVASPPERQRKRHALCVCEHPFAAHAAETGGCMAETDAGGEEQEGICPCEKYAPKKRASKKKTAAEPNPCICGHGSGSHVMTPKPGECLRCVCEIYEPNTTTGAPAPAKGPTNGGESLAPPGGGAQPELLGAAAHEASSLGGNNPSAPTPAGHDVPGGAEHAPAEPGAPGAIHTEETTPTPSAAGQRPDSSTLTHARDYLVTGKAQGQIICACGWRSELAADTPGAIPPELDRAWARHAGLELPAVPRRCDSCCELHLPGTACAHQQPPTGRVRVRSSGAVWREPDPPFCPVHTLQDEPKGRCEACLALNPENTSAPAAVSDATSAGPTPAPPAAAGAGTTSIPTDRAPCPWCGGDGLQHSSEPGVCEDCLGVGSVPLGHPSLGPPRSVIGAMPALPAPMAGAPSLAEEIESALVEREAGLPFLDDSTAAWAMKRLIENEAARARIDAQYRSMVAAIQSDSRSVAFRHGRELREWARRKIEAQPGKSKNVKTFDGTASFRTVPGGPRVSDKQALTAWCERQDDPTKYGAFSYSLAWAKVKAHVKGTGERPPGVEIADGREVFAIRAGETVVNVSDLIHAGPPENEPDEIEHTNDEEIES